MRLVKNLFLVTTYSSIYANKVLSIITCKAEIKLTFWLTSKILPLKARAAFYIVLWAEMNITDNVVLDAGGKSAD